MKNKNLLFFVLLSFSFLFILAGNSLFAQEFYRFKADYSIKITDNTSKPVMKMGKLYYDKNVRKIVVKNGFPVKEMIVYSDTSVYFIRVGRIVKKMRNLAPVDLSIFHLAMNSNLMNYGLDKAGYVMEDLARDKGLVIVSWMPNNIFKDKLGKILTSTKGKQLYSVVFLDKNDKTISKHIFQKYVNINGFEFPSEVVRIFYDGDKERYEITSYRNIVLNEKGSDEFYNYQISE